MPDFANQSSAYAKSFVCVFVCLYVRYQNIHLLRLGQFLSNSNVQIKLVKILQELAESEPKAYPRHKRKNGQNYLNKTKKIQMIRVFVFALERYLEKIYRKQRCILEYLCTCARALFSVRE